MTEQQDQHDAADATDAVPAPRGPVPDLGFFAGTPQPHGTGAFGGPAPASTGPFGAPAPSQFGGSPSAPSQFGGFASAAAGNPVTEADERAKLRLVVEAAREIWG